MLKLAMQKALVSKVENNLLLTFNILWLVYLILHNLLSGRVWLWNAFSIIPPISFISFTLLICSITVLIYIKRILNFDRKSFIILIVLILNISLSLFISDLNFNALLPKEDYSEDKVITVFNLNTHFWEGPTFEAEFIEYLRKQDADIYQLQEFIPYYPVNSVTFENFHKEQIALLEEAFPDYNLAYEGEFLILFRDDFHIINDSRVKGEYFFKVDLEVDGEIISFYNVHIPVQFFGRNTGATAEVKDLRDKFNLRRGAFDQLVRDIESNERQYFISGDFNSTKSMGVMNRMLRLGHDSIKASNTFYPATWQIKEFKLWRIDYALVSRALEFVDHEYIDSLDFSDHSGIRVKFRIN